MKAFVLIVATDSSRPFLASVPDSGFDTVWMFLSVLLALIGYAVTRRIRQRRAAQRRAQRKARGTLLTALRIDSILKFKAAKEKALTPNSEMFGTQVWNVKKCRKSISKGDRVSYLGWCTAIVDDFDKDDNLMVTQPCGCTDVWPRSCAVRLISVGDRVHYPGNLIGTVEGFDEDGDYKVTTKTLGSRVFYSSKCQQGIGSLPREVDQV